jgi:hypothetical protein
LSGSSIGVIDESSCEVGRWEDLRWHDINRNFYEAYYRCSSNIEVLLRQFERL